MMRSAYLPRVFDQLYYQTAPPILKGSALGISMEKQPFAALSQQTDREKWLKSRFHKVTGSAFYSILDRKGDTPESLKERRESYFRVMAGLPGAFDERLPEKGTYQRAMMEFGTNHEPEARCVCEWLLDRDIFEIGFWLDREHPWAGASVDGVDADMSCIYEFKCRGPGSKEPHKEPTHYHVDQMQWNMMILGVNSCEWLSYSKIAYNHRTVFADHLHQLRLLSKAREVMVEYLEWVKKYNTENETKIEVPQDIIVSLTKR